MSISPLPFTQKAKHSKIKELNTQEYPTNTLINTNSYTNDQ